MTRQNTPIRTARHEPRGSRLSSNWFAASTKCLGIAVLVGLLALPAAAVDRRRTGGRPQRGSAQVSGRTVELFQGIETGEIEVRFIAKNDRAANVFIANKTKEPLTIELPAAFAGVPVLAQVGGGGGGFGGGGSSSSSGGSQSLGGGGGGGFGGGGGGFFNVAPEKVGLLQIDCLCLDHGKPDPTPHIPYEIRPIESVVQQQSVIELIKAFGTGRLSHSAAQAAVWHLNNGVTWEELARKRGPRRYALRPKPPYFSPAELRLAFQLASEAVRRAGLEQGGRSSLSQSASVIDQ